MLLFNFSKYITSIMGQVTIDIYESMLINYLGSIGMFSDA